MRRILRSKATCDDKDTNSMLYHHQEQIRSQLECTIIITTPRQGTEYADFFASIYEISETNRICSIHVLSTPDTWEGCFKDHA